MNGIFFLHDWVLGGGGGGGGLRRRKGVINGISAPGILHKWDVGKEGGKREGQGQGVWKGDVSTLAIVHE